MINFIDNSKYSVINYCFSLVESQKRADSLLRCLEELDKTLNNRKEDIRHISNTISSGSLMVTDKPQVSHVYLQHWFVPF